MRYLLDTNIVLRSLQKAAPEHQMAIDAIARLVGRGEILHISTQVCIEFWVVATRPIMINGLGWDSAHTESELNLLLNRFALLEDRPTVFTHWRQLVTTHAIKGKKAHDARLVAVMQAHNITHLLTLNTDDFRAYPNIILLHPDDIS
ncbi:MAG: type II toxin-antitoxin system VapC family toxin [Candidatus Binatia bacterium]